mmetsp:Transcript_24981/g.24443  ORF Transcript_24981/g.24443 Transcript_24981/m.24443 type:complete len:221 (-) Transcript_24981:237-899(-)
MLILQGLQGDWELHITRSHNILNFKIFHVYLQVSNFLDGFGVLLGSVLAQLFRLCPRADHFPRRKYQSSRFRFSDPHDDSCEPLRVVLSIPAVECNFSQVQLAAQVGSGDDILELGLRDVSGIVLDLGGLRGGHQVGEQLVVTTWGLIHPWCHCALILELTPVVAIALGGAAIVAIVKIEIIVGERLTLPLHNSVVELGLLGVIVVNLLIRLGLLTRRWL